MAQTFEINPIRKLGSNGLPEAIGFEWTEEASWRHSQKLMLLFTGIPIAFGLLWAGYVMWYWGGGPWLLLVDAVFAGMMIAYMVGKLPRRAVVLDRDGKVRVPHSVPGEKGGKWLKVRQPDVVGFEIGPAWGAVGMADWTSTVVAVSRKGETVTISRYLHREEAREIVVGLNMALAEMRKSVGTEPARIGQPLHARSLVE